jgi:hypothetical protein
VIRRKNMPWIGDPFYQAFAITRRQSLEKVTIVVYIYRQPCDNPYILGKLAGTTP